ncbi:unnamed protein product [Allacma fusca]|uniref:Reticulocalbin-3 n=1 Tax=Allacma fusca TaxID=39272 RepID=A0A8J2P226_9HEXA|nr:unnamed protein product [Allacma fusca]
MYVISIEALTADSVHEKILKLIPFRFPFRSGSGSVRTSAVRSAQITVQVPKILQLYKRESGKLKRLGDIFMTPVWIQNGRMKMSQKLLTLCIFITLCTAFALPKHASDTKRLVEKPLSEQEHFLEGNHNTAYDHEAFLGEEAKQFDDLSPEESRRRLGLIFDKIDANKDGLIQSYELKKWIEWTQRRYIIADGETQWRIHNPERKDKILWSEYRKSTYSFLDEENRESNDFKTYSRMIERDRRRWQVADENGDDALTQEEFLNFIHPEGTPHMHDLIVIETIEDIDKDGDGRISMEEYIQDLYRGDPGDEEPSWVTSERETFSQYRDKNGDGYLDQSEVKQWIMPDDFDQAAAETSHLIHASDANNDGNLTKQEVLDKYDVFVGSQATDFGEALIKHDEF